MTRASATGRADRILVRDGRRHHRRTYSRVEFRIGLLVLAGLIAVVAWVAWRGAHPDPALFSTPVAGLGAPGELVAGGGAAIGGEAGAPGADRGPLPVGLATPGWTEGRVSSFDPTNLYVKINGREEYYKSFGFRRLWFLSIVSDADPQVAVDIEAFDLGEAANALGAYAGERAPGVLPVVGPRGLEHLDRNALFLTRGPWYVRAIGSDESPAVLAQLESLRETIGDALPGEALPGAWAIFVGAMGFDPGQVSYTAENTFSFGFAKDVYSARLDDDTEPFVIEGESAEAASALAARVSAAFREYGESAGRSGGVDWSKDRWLGAISGATVAGRWTIGVYGAPDVAGAEKILRKLEAGVRALPGESQP